MSLQHHNDLAIDLGKDEGRVRRHYLFCTGSGYPTFYNRLFYRYGGYIEFIRFKDYYGMPGGSTRLVFTRAFGQKENFTVYFSKGAIIITPKQGKTIFLFHYNLFLGKGKEKLARKTRVNTERVYRIVLMALGIR